VKNLRERRLHARPLAGRKDDNVNIRHVDVDYLADLGRTGRRRSGMRAEPVDDGASSAA
jgi:hypothetical protein